MKNKDKYDLRLIKVKPKYMVSGCGKRITDNFTFDVYYKSERVAKDIKAKKSTFEYFMQWLELDE